jgi:dihydrodipicolinate synthase/N-acetylneuraminate lyase
MNFFNDLPFRGIVPPLVTPLESNDQLDYEGLERLIEHVIGGGVHGVFILGTTGEFASLSYRIRRELIDLTCRQVKGRVPVLVGITDSSFSESLNIAAFAAENGADAVVLAPPFYYATSQPELCAYVTRIMAHMPLPLFIYNMPAHTKVVFEPESVRMLSEIRGIIGMKDSSANLPYLNQVRYLLHDRPDFTFMVGPEEILSEFLLTGGHGGVNGGANLFPRLYVDMYNACMEHDFEHIALLQQKIMQVSSTVYRVGKYGSSYLKGLKCALSCMGICNDFMAEPFTRFNEPEKEKIREILEMLNYHEMI